MLIGEQADFVASFGGIHLARMFKRTAIQPALSAESGL
jgi:hypothetical protein